MGASDVTDIRTGSVAIGALDAFEGLNIAQMAAAGLLGAFPHMTTPNAGRPVSALSVGFNLSKWQGLSELDQMLLESCIKAEHGVSRARAMHDSIVTLQSAGRAVTPHVMPQDIWEAQISASNTTMLEIIESDNLGADIGDAYLYFIGDVAGWSEIGETAFFLGRKGALAQ
jgi:TRAP-type mannitol/chloroaromatic compound transport system substrate-binding protein